MFHYAWVVAFTGTLVLILSHGFGRMSYSVILGNMKDGLALNYTQIGLIGTGNFIGYLCLAVIGGFLASRYGPRKVLFVSLLVMGVSLFLTGLSDSFGFAFFMRLITGMGNGGSYVPMMALPAAWFAARKRGLATGIVFGFLLQKGGVTDYEVIMGQLLLTDFTVVKVMLSAIFVGMIGIYAMRPAGLVRLHCRMGSAGSTVIGGLIFGTGFALLGYCPGTVAGAIGQGALDALFGGVVGLLIGAGIFAELYPSLNKRALSYGTIEEETVPELLRVNEWIIVIGGFAIIVLFLVLLEVLGL